MAVTPDGRGYWMVGADGGVFAFGDAQYYGGMAARSMAAPVVGMAPTPDGRGYWLAAADGGVFAFGDAPFLGGLSGHRLAAAVVGITAAPTGAGYWLVGADGGVFGFGAAAYYGSMGGHRLASAVVGLTPSADGRGYWLVGSDGGVFTFGDAAYHGGMAGDGLRAPIVGLARTPAGTGYWLVASDGGVFTYGDAPYLGGMGGRGLVAPVVALAPTPDGRGYWMVAADGGVFTYGTARYEGSTWSAKVGRSIMESLRPPPPPPPPVAIFYYPWYSAPATSGAWRHWNEGGHNPPGDIGSDFYPARGAYDSSDPAVVSGQMSDIAGAGVNEIVVSWWGRGSFEDSQLPLVTQTAAQHGLAVAIHLEPYQGRSAGSVTSDIAYLRGRFSVSQFFVYDAGQMSASAWASVTRNVHGVTIWATGDPGAMKSGSFERWAASAGFNGVYTYDGMNFAGSDFGRVCGAAHHDGLMCSPSVAPGFEAVRATGGSAVRSRANGATYDSMWQGALAAGADLISITSYNEWHEGTQIEAAQPFCASGFCYQNYDGAYGATGQAAQSAYLARTSYWIGRLRG